jgi:hypothetical protein
MKPSKKQFLECLFDADHKTAWGKIDAWASKAEPVWPDMLFSTAEKFCINPLETKRNEQNVKHVYAMLFEMDKTDNGKIIPRDTQVSMVRATGLPYSTMTWSGTKSVHVIVRLDRPIPKDIQPTLWKTIREILVQKGLPIDPRTKHIPQLSRLPGGLREIQVTNDEGQVIDVHYVEQELIEVRSRVSMQELGQWLKANGKKIEKPKPPKPFVLTNPNMESTKKFEIARKWTEKSHGMYTTSWQTGGHMWLFQLGVNANKVGLDINQTISYAMIEWGAQYMTSAAGKQDITIPITKGWTWCQTNKK